MTKFVLILESKLKLLKNLILLNNITSIFSKKLSTANIFSSKLSSKQARANSSLNPCSERGMLVRILLEMSPRLWRGLGQFGSKPNLVDRMGLEPTTSSMPSRRSSQLSYRPKIFIILPYFATIVKH